MSEINVEIDKHMAINLLPNRQVLKCLVNGRSGDVALETVLTMIKRSQQVGFCARGQAYAMGLSLWAKNHQGGTVFIETNRDAVDGLSLSLGIDLPN